MQVVPKVALNQSLTLIGVKLDRRFKLHLNFCFCLCYIHFEESVFVGHFLLTNLLLEKMKSTSRKSGIEGRIVIVSSEGHRLTYWDGIRFNKINNRAE